MGLWFYAFFSRYFQYVHTMSMSRHRFLVLSFFFHSLLSPSPSLSPLRFFARHMQRISCVPLLPFPKYYKFRTYFLYLRLSFFPTVKCRQFTSSSSSLFSIMGVSHDCSTVSVFLLQFRVFSLCFFSSLPRVFYPNAVIPSHMIILDFAGKFSAGSFCSTHKL